MYGLTAKTVWGGFTLQVWAYIAAAALVVALALVGGGYGYGHGAGKVAGIASMQKQVDALKAESLRKERVATAALAAANAKNRSLEQTHAQEVSDLRADYARQDAEARSHDAAVIAGLRAGNQRLRFAVLPPHRTDASPFGPAPGGAEGEAYAELAPATSAALYSIASDGDAAIRQSNALNDWADSAVKMCNGGQPPPKVKQP